MIDIVERCRNHSAPWAQEAAAEIERLRQEAANYKHALFSAVENVHKPQMANAEAEIERLRTSNAELLAALKQIEFSEGHSWIYRRIARAAIEKAEKG